MCKFSSKSGGVPFQPLGDLTWNDPSSKCIILAVVRTVGLKYSSLGWP